MSEPVRTEFVDRIKPRSDNLALLADAVRQFLEPRHHTEFVEQRVVEDGQSKRKRVPYATTHPGLLQALREAAEPGGGADAILGGSFESQPAAAIPAVNLLRDIRDGVVAWGKALNCLRPVGKPTLERTLSALVGARHTDSQLDNLRYEVCGWARKADIVVGWVEPPLTIDQPCPQCWRRNVLTITGDLRSARCSKCGTEWDETTIGLLSAMLTANQQQETMAGKAVCASQGCYLTPGHVGEHRDGNGRFWPNEWVPQHPDLIA